MNLDSQKTRPGRFLDATDATSAPLDGGQSGKIRLGFKATDFVVYPAHGVGQIQSIEEQTVAGASVEFFVIFFTKNKLTVTRPRPKSREYRNAQTI
jgi:CarD family transcriptional regulator